MMKIVIASDSFKGSSSSLEVANSIEKGLLRSKLDLDIVKVAVADGGEGTMEALVLAFDGYYKEVEVLDPLARLISSRYGVLDKDSVVIEMAAASGLTLISKAEQSPLQTTSYGTGQLIREVMNDGYTNIYIGLGGSATTDGGVGAVQALGGSFLDINGNEVGFGNQALKSIETIDISNIDKRLNDVKITILSDVNNPLIGKNGAARVFGPQKGATDTEVEIMESNLTHYSSKVKEFINIDISNLSKAGSAGGLGGGLLAFCKAEMTVGIDKILNLINFKDTIKDADMVITGEGKIDGQSIYGKTPVGVAKLAKKNNIFTVAIVGSVGEGADKVYKKGIDMIISIVNKPMTLEKAILKVDKLVSEAAYNFINAYNNIIKYNKKN
ncbi:MAG TPA: glycerate kinase [Erysipelotrichaceae bacterium]|nr:glycerate kinase [Erysipelotrichaceae bacterium]